MNKPNILIILADDMGFSDIGSFGSEIPTPALDELAEKGVRFTQFYNCARCCPSRASLLTGCHPHRAGVGAMVADQGHRGYRGFIRPDVPTIAELLKNSGYYTWMSGKWHCGGHYHVHIPEQWRQEAGNPTHPLPTQRGFDRYYGTLAGAGSYYDPPVLMDQNRLVDIKELPGDYYLTEELGRRAQCFIMEAASVGKPFFGYLAFTAPHWPLHAPERNILPFRGRYDIGWDAVRETRLKSLIKQGILRPDIILSQRDEEAPDWDNIGHKRWWAELMAVYAAQVAIMDQAIAGVIECLKRLGMFENTLTIFLSDNGGCAEFLREDTPRGKWPEFYNLPTKTGRRCVVGNNPARMPGGPETFMSYQLPWANASNTPFRKFKAWTHEGGISTPFIACWPIGLPAGGIVHTAAHIMDLAPTLCAIAEVRHDEMDGASILPVARGEENRVSRPEPICWEHCGHAAVRSGRWKIVRAGQNLPWELYDMETDRIEENNLAASMPDIVAELAGLYDRWAVRCGVLPLPIVPLRINCP